MHIMPNIHFSKDEIIFKEGHPADAVYLICEGNVSISKTVDNVSTELATLGEGKIFGEMAFISDKPRSATVTVIDDVWCYKVGKDHFIKLLQGTDQEIVNIFNDLVNTIRKKSNTSASIMTEDQEEITDSLELKSIVSPDKIKPQYSKQHLLEDSEIRSKIEQMDTFTRQLYYSLVEIAFKIEDHN